MVTAKKELAIKVLEMEKLQQLIAPLMLLAMMAVGPLVDFYTMVLQKLQFLALLEVSYPINVQVFLALFGSLGKSSGGTDYSLKNRDKEPPLFDKMLNITMDDQLPPMLFQRNKMNPLFIKEGLMPIIQLLAVYLMSVYCLALDRRYKTFTPTNDWHPETDFAKDFRLKKYTGIKLLKQQLVWKNFLRAAQSAFQPLFFVICLNIKQASFTKWALTVSSLLAMCAFCALVIITALIGYSLSIMLPINFKTEKLYEKHIRLFYEGLIKPFNPRTEARYLKWFDVFLKKGFMIAIVVYLYEYPMIVSIILVLTTGFDMWLASQDLTGIKFLNY
jgi:hypothetical protein